MFYSNISISATESETTSDFTSSGSLSSYPSTTISLTSCPPTPDDMDFNQSDNEARSSEPIAESQGQEYIQLNHQDGLKMASDVSNQGDLGGESAPKAPAREHLFPRSPKGQESPVAIAIHRVINNDHEHNAPWFPQSPTFLPVNMVSEECSCSLRSDGSRQESRERSPTAGRRDSQQPQLGKLNGSSQHSWRESDMAQTRGSSAREPSSVDDQSRAAAEVQYPRNPLRAGQPVLDRYPRDDALGAAFDTPSQWENVLPPIQMTTSPLPDMPGPHRNPETLLPPLANTSPPSTAELVEGPLVHRWRSRPNYPWSGFLPDVYESRRLELQTVDGGPPRLVQGPTQHLGPPLKPFDGARAGEVAIEQWRRVVREREIREAGGV